jgi:hypothetical protein
MMKREIVPDSVRTFEALPGEVQDRIVRRFGIGDWIAIGDVGSQFALISVADEYGPQSVGVVCADLPGGVGPETPTVFTW